MNCRNAAGATRYKHLLAISAVAVVLAAGSTPAAAAINLTVGINSPTSEELVPGQKVSFASVVTVNNTGGSPVSISFCTGYYYSLNNVISTGNDVLLTDKCQTNYSAAPGVSTINENILVAVPIGATQKNRWLGAYVDYKYEVAESSESDNTSSLPITVWTAPDLLISAYSVLPPTSTAPGGYAKVEFRVYNQSLVAAGPAGGFPARVYYSEDNTITTSDAVIGETVIASLGGKAYSPGETTFHTLVVRIPDTAAPGSRYLGFIVDPGNAVNENDGGYNGETNNAYSAAITVGTSYKPDLQVTALTATPNSGSQNASVTVNFSVRNSSDYLAGPHLVGIYMSADNTITTSDTLLTTHSITSLNPNTTASNSAVVTVPYSIPPGTRYFGAVADYQGNVDESNEANNTRSAAFTVTGGADLQPLNLVIGPTSGTVGTTVGVSFQVRNAGTTASGAYTVNVYFSEDNAITTSDIYRTAINMPSLGAGVISAVQNVNVTVPSSAAVGQGYFGVLADPNGGAGETNETNNAAAAEFYVSPIVSTYDLQPVSIVPSWTGDMGAGRSVRLTGQVRNNGQTAVSSANVGFSFSYDAVCDGTNDVPMCGSGALPACPTATNVPPGSSGNVTVILDTTVPPYVAGGTGYFCMAADYDLAILETNENNNAMSYAFTVNGLPDLAVLSGWAGSGLPNSAIDVSYTYGNAASPTDGTGASVAGPFKVRLYLSQDDTYGGGDTLLDDQVYSYGSTPSTCLPPGASSSTIVRTVTIPGSAAPGAWYILARIDDPPAVAESNENNNMFALSIRVLKPTGSQCSLNDECEKGVCADGVCCDKSCTRQCEACDTSGHVGECVPVTGAPHGSRQACTTDGTVCGGACDGFKAEGCTYPADEIQCRAPACVGGTATLEAQCAGNGSCPAEQKQDCAPFVCGSTACAGPCLADADCVNGYFCSAGVCAEKLQQGQACAGDNQCKSGPCVDGVCCAVACTGQCEACDVPGHLGSCWPVAGIPHGGRAACQGLGACAGYCDGSSAAACFFPGGDTACGEASCSAGVAVPAPVCDGAGSCKTSAGNGCGHYACSGNGCGTSCMTDNDCAAGFVCLEGECQTVNGSDGGAARHDGGLPAADGGTNQGQAVENGGCSVTGLSGENSITAPAALLMLFLTLFIALRGRRR